MENLDTYRTYLLSECGRSEKQAKAHVGYMRRFATWLNGRHALATVPLAEVREYIREQSRRRLKPRSIIKIVNQVRAYLRFAHAYGYRAVNDGANLEAPKGDHRTYLLPSAAEVKAHIAAAKSLRDRAILALLYSSGLREAELCALKIEDIEDWDKGCIRVNGGKGEKDRIVYADAATIGRMGAYLDSRPQPLFKSDWVFPLASDSSRSMDPTYINPIVTRTAKAAGVRTNVTPHMCRRYFATNMLRQLRAKGNFDCLAMVSRLLGHSDLQSTMPYIVFDDDERKREHALRHPRERMARGEPAWVPLV